eukprot:4511809-Pyramimonas_sp.AAC.1
MMKSTPPRSSGPFWPRRSSCRRGALEDRPRCLLDEGGRPMPEAAQGGDCGDGGWVDGPPSAH